MNIDLNEISLSGIISFDHWSLHDLNHIFGSNAENLDVSTITIDQNSENHWIWVSNASNTKLSSAVYHTLIKQPDCSSAWAGWNIVWSIPVAPKIKHFIWLCLRGRLSTSAFLHSIHLGPDNPCVFCGLHRETIDHLFYHCDRIRLVWDHVNRLLNSSFTFSDSFSSGNWVLEHRHSRYNLAIIAACAWFIWVCRCDYIFRDSRPIFPSIFARAVAHVEEFSWCNSKMLGRNLLLANFSSADDYFLFSHATSDQSIGVSSTGFFFSNANYMISIAGSSSRPLSDTHLDAILAVEVALQAALDLHIPVKHILCDHAAITHLLNCSDHIASWRFEDQVNNLKFLLDACGHPRIHIIPSFEGYPAASLATYGLLHQQLNLFLFGKDLPFWIMKSFRIFGFSF